MSMTLSLPGNSANCFPSRQWAMHNAEETERRENLKSAVAAFLEHRSSLAISLNASNYVHSPEINLGQILAYYEAQSRREDVSFYFSEKLDWRLVHLMPVCKKNNRVGFVLSNLFAALYRLRHDGGMTYYAMQHFIDAATVFRTFDDAIDRTWVLATVAMYMQYDATTNLGKEMATHMRIASTLVRALQIRDQSTMSPLQTCLVTILAVYDITNAFLTGAELFLGEAEYRHRLIDCHQANMHLTESSIEQMWYYLHSIWAQLTDEIQSIRRFETSDLAQSQQSISRLQYLLTLLADFNAIFEHNSRFRPSKSPLQFQSPIGSSIWYPSPALRLLHSAILMLLITCISFTSDSALNSREAIQRYRDTIISSHVHLFNGADSRYRVRKDERNLHQTFPATAMLMVAASEVYPREHRLQKWFHQAAQRMNAHGWSLGLLLMRVITGSEGVAFSSWQYIGTKQFLFRAWYLRERNVA